MSVFRRGRFMAVRWAIGFGVLAAFPFLCSGVAQAAMAGANPMTTTNRPDLRTVHVSTFADSGEWCFDKTVANQKLGGGPLLGSDFMLGGYRFDTFVTAQASSVNTEAGNSRCVTGAIATKSDGSTRDLQSYSYGSVNDKAVVNQEGGGAAAQNIGDSTANLDSNSHNGTADHTQGPDLQGVAVDQTNNRLNYVFDQPVWGGSLNLGDMRFLYYDANGAAHWGSPIGSGGNIVSVQFGAPFGPGTDTVTRRFRLW